jgi:hypothetical protein
MIAPKEYEPSSVTDHESDMPANAFTGFIARYWLVIVAVLAILVILCGLFFFNTNIQFDGPIQQ